MSKAKDEGEGLLDPASLATGLESGAMRPFPHGQNGVIAGTQSRHVGVAEDDVLRRGASHNSLARSSSSLILAGQSSPMSSWM